jgi:hypothetical protein
VKTLLAFLLLTTVASAQDVVPLRISTRGNVELSDAIHGNWLTVHRVDANAKDFDASFVYLTCDFVPTIKKLSDGHYQITFSSEIAKGLP